MDIYTRLNEDAKIKEQTNCNVEIERLNAQLTALINQPVTQTSCNTMLDALETLDVSFTLDVEQSPSNLFYLLFFIIFNHFSIFFTLT